MLFGRDKAWRLTKENPAIGRQISSHPNFRTLLNDQNEKT
jgi:hypothetical protein